MATDYIIKPVGGDYSSVNAALNAISWGVSEIVNLIVSEDIDESSNGGIAILVDLNGGELNIYPDVTHGRKINTYVTNGNEDIKIAPTNGTVNIYGLIFTCEKSSLVGATMLSSSRSGLGLTVNIYNNIFNGVNSLGAVSGAANGLNCNSYNGQVYNIYNNRVNRVNSGIEFIAAASGEIHVSYNTVDNCNQYGIEVLIGAGSNTYLKNNVCVRTSVLGTDYKFSGTSGNIEIDNNSDEDGSIVGYTPSIGHNNNSTTIPDPALEFVSLDYTSDDYLKLILGSSDLIPGSPTLGNTGIDVSGIVTDLINNDRPGIDSAYSRGCYEQQFAATTITPRPIYWFPHLLPRGKAWSITINKRLRQLFEGLSNALINVKTFFDLIWLDIFPDTTREIETWEKQFGIIDNGTTSEADRRTRLDAAWKLYKVVSREQIEQALRDAGFDVYVHEWWIPGTEAAIGVHAPATPRNPRTYLAGAAFACGETLAQCGEPEAQCGNTVTSTVVGYPLVNKITSHVRSISARCGEPGALCGEPAAQCGNFVSFEKKEKVYTVPTDPKYWPFFLYIGGQTFGTAANIDTDKREELENLCLKICQTQNWLGMLINYV